MWRSPSRGPAPGRCAGNGVRAGAGRRRREAGLCGSGQHSAPAGSFLPATSSAPGAERRPSAAPAAADRVGGGVLLTSSTPLSLEDRRANSSGSPGVSLPRRRVPVPQPSYLSPGAAWRTGLAGPLRWYPPQPQPQPQPQPGRLAWPRGTPEEAGLSLTLAGFLPAPSLPTHPADIHPQSRWEVMTPWRGPHGDLQCPGPLAPWV